jgi:hypothetical protein
MEFWQEVDNRVMGHLIASGGKLNGKYIQNLECPSCGNREAYANASKPSALYCNRKNKCGSTTDIDARIIAPDLFQDFHKNHPPTKSNPKATAKAYLKSRGLNPDDVEFEQKQINVDGKEYPAVGFRLDKDTINHRLIDYTGKDKTRTYGEYSGKIWKKQKLNFKQPIYITEAVLDSLSLIQGACVQSVSCLSSGHIPKEFYQSLPEHAQIVLAFDNDKAGREATSKHRNFLIEHSSIEKSNVSVSLPPSGKDWNDMLQDVGEEMKLSEHAEWEWCEWRGKLLMEDMSGTFDEYLKIYSEKYTSEHGLYLGFLIFRRETWFVSFKTEKTDGVSVIVPVSTRLLNGEMTLLYDLVDESLPYGNKAHHRFKWEPKNGQQSLLEMNSESFGKTESFRTRLLPYRGVFYGNQHQLNKYIEYFFRHNPPRIRQLTAFGYDPKSDCFVYSHRLYDADGKRFEIGKDAYFEKQNLSPFLEKSSIPKVGVIDYSTLLDHLYGAFGNRGLLALGFWVTSIFSHVVFEEFRFFPFLSLYGDPRTGKSFLVLLLNRMFGLDMEGLPATKDNTSKGEKRRMSQFSSMVIPMLEAQEGSTRFDFNDLLPMYNRNPAQTRAATTNNNETIEIPFHATLTFVQNHEQFKTRAAMERVVSIQFADTDITDESFEHFQKLSEFSPENLTSFGDHILKNRKYFEEAIVNAVQTFSDLFVEKGVWARRIADNHAIAFAGFVLMNSLVEWKSDADLKSLTGYMVQLGKTKIETARSETPNADTFLELLENVADGNAVKRKGNNIYIRLGDALKAVEWPKSNSKELIAEFKRHDNFKGYINHRIFGNGPQKVWHFEVKPLSDM